MKRVREVYLPTRSNILHFGYDPDYDTDPESDPDRFFFFFFRTKECDQNLNHLRRWINFDPVFLRSVDSGNYPDYNSDCAAGVCSL